MLSGLGTLAAPTWVPSPPAQWRPLGHTECCSVSQIPFFRQPHLYSCFILKDYPSLFKTQAFLGLESLKHQCSPCGFFQLWCLVNDANDSDLGAIPFIHSFLKWPEHPLQALRWVPCLRLGACDCLGPELCCWFFASSASLVRKQISCSLSLCSGCCPSLHGDRAALDPGGWTRPPAGLQLSVPCQAPSLVHLHLIRKSWTWKQRRGCGASTHGKALAPGVHLSPFPWGSSVAMATSRCSPQGAWRFCTECLCSLTFGLRFGLYLQGCRLWLCLFAEWLLFHHS